MKYRFTDPGEQPKGPGLPSSAMLFDGQYLERRIPGYLTLNVTGREYQPAKPDLFRVPGRPGKIVRDRVIHERYIEIEYSLRGKDAADVLKKADQLRHVLTESEDVKVAFLDEPGVYYKGFVSDISDPPPERLHYSGTFTICCPDPFKYTELTSTGMGDSNGYNIGLAVPDIPDVYVLYIQVSLFPSQSAGRNIRIHNEGTGDVIVITPDETSINFYKSNTLRIDFRNGLHARIVENNQNVDRDIVFNLTTFDFKFNAGDRIAVDGGTGLIIHYQRRWL